jgi:hypothetical protein
MYSKVLDLCSTLTYSADKIKLPNQLTYSYWSDVNKIGLLVPFTRQEKCLDQIGIASTSDQPVTRLTPDWFRNSTYPRLVARIPSNGVTRNDVTHMRSIVICCSLKMSSAYHLSESIFGGVFFVHYPQLDIYYCKSPWDSRLRETMLISRIIEALEQSSWPSEFWHRQVFLTPNVACAAAFTGIYFITLVIQCE